MTRNCVICGKSFESQISRKITCSPICSKKRHNERQREKYREMMKEQISIIPNKYCIVCGKEFEPARRYQKCCSPECSIINSNHGRKQKFKNQNTKPGISMKKVLKAMKKYDVQYIKAVKMLEEGAT